MPGFEIEQEAVTGSDKLKLTISLSETAWETGCIVIDSVLTNMSEQPFRLLRWQTPFTKFVGGSVFNVRRNGNRLPYHGRMVRRRGPRSDDYINLPTASTLSGRLDITNHYNFRESGAYEIQYKNLMLLPKGEHIAVRSNTIEISISR